MFQKAVPIWIPFKNEQEKLNCHLIFRARAADLRGVHLSLAAADFYRLSVNGRFVGFGPARCAKGYARVDNYDLTEYASDRGENTIIVEVAGYHCSSLSAVKQASFFAAELTLNGNVVLFTGRDFECYRNVRRVRKTERYSVQRHFGEIYDEAVANPFAEEYREETLPISTKICFLPRRVPMPSYTVSDKATYTSRGTFALDTAKAPRIHAYSFPPENEPDWGYFPEDEVEDKPFRRITGQASVKTAGGGNLPLTIKEGEWVLFDLNRIEVGFLRWSGEAQSDTKVTIAFTEICENDVFSFTPMNVQNVVSYRLPEEKEISAESFEPYSMRMAAFYVEKGSLTITSFGIRTFERDISSIIPRKFNDSELQAIYNAAVRTFAHNAIDLFTDCPSRERAGWLCDSFFTGRAEQFLFGETPVEDAFLENYILYRNEGEYPQGVLPMCYPSEPHQSNKFIPQWNMWYVLEVCEYLSERHPEKDRSVFLPSVNGILSFLEKYENSLGLLEKLPSWNFVEWSKANTWVQDISYPTNFLYAGMLEAVANVFGESKYLEKADKIRKTILEHAFDGNVFVDNATVSEDGTVKNTYNVSEAGQYYAILFGGFSLDEKRFAVLKQHVIDNFSAFKEADTSIYDFCPINAFIGLYLRMNVLLNLGDSVLLRKNLKEFFNGMCEKTETLWEYKTAVGSLDHGFASYVALTLPTADNA